jgi:hypothetical protein
MKHTFALLLASLAASGAWAQTPAAPLSIGVTDNVSGLVTVSQGNTMANAVPGGALFDGARVVTTSTGSVVLRLRNGCNIALASNQSIVLDGKQRDCKALIASIQSAAPGATAGAAAATTGGVHPVLIGAGALLLMGAAGGGGGSSAPLSGS